MPEQAGLQRNNVPFEPIAQLTTGYGIRSREETMAREAAGVAAIPDDVKETVRGLLVAIGCEPELRALNYIWWSTTPAANAGSAPTPKLIVESARMRARTSTPAKAQCPWPVPVLQTLDSPERRVLQTPAAAARDADFIPHRKKRPRADVDNRHDGDVEWAQHPELAQNELLADTTPSRCARRVLRPRPHIAEKRRQPRPKVLQQRWRKTKSLPTRLHREARATQHTTSNWMIR